MSCAFVNKDAGNDRRRIAPNSPPGRALLAARFGDVVTWNRPTGSLDLAIIRIAHAYP